MFNFRNDIDSILKFLTTAISKLEAHAAGKAEEAAQHVIKAAESTAKAGEAAAAQAKAATIAAKLRALL